MQFKRGHLALIGAALGLGLSTFAINIYDGVRITDLQGEVRDLSSQLDTAVAGGDVSPESIAAALDTECPTEDSVNCYWLAGTNREGLAFVNIEGHLFPLTSVLEG